MSIMMTFTGNIFLDLFGFITSLLVVIFAYYKWTYQYWERQNVPYLEPTIPFGNFSNHLNINISLSDTVRRMYDKARAKGWKFCGIYEMARPSIMIVDLDLAKHVMTKDFGHFVDRKPYVNDKDDPLGSHLFSIGGKKWRNLRVKVTPTFTSGKLKAMFQTLADCGVILENYFEEVLNKEEPVDIKDVFARFTIDIIGSCAFGLDCNSFKEENSPFRIYGQKFFAMTKLRALRLALAFNFPALGRFLKVRMVDKDITEFFTKVVEDTVVYREKNNVSRNDVLQLLIDIKNNKEGREDGYKGDGKSLTMDELAAQCFVFFLAGFETSSTTATFVLFELATHQDIQDKVREEIRTVLAKHDDRITYDSLNEMAYMTQVIDEALRKYPPLPLVTRVCVEDYKVPGENTIIEKGTNIVIPIMGYHYDMEFYDDPTKFNPDRFTDEHKETRHPYAHIPFGEGPRVCIGERFGVMQTKVGLTSILRNFRVTLNKGTQLPLKFSVKSNITTAEGGIWLDIEKV
ncbi:cytochrome P450 6a2 isoform X1 [Anoplophora glabripennis]|uniref:cytochrome P450 6a2 isoform X1 n=2 Tax=Anoplophora glabripennis TaxID=217634 RepID=UPI0008757105|nr:cytochrome P450 6a2 isoform X1 [Anoplophora glabripennis]